MNFFAAAGGALLLHAVLVPMSRPFSLRQPVRIAAGAAVLVLGQKGIARQRSAGIAAGGIRRCCRPVHIAAPFVPA